MKKVCVNNGKKVAIAKDLRELLDCENTRIVGCFDDMKLIGIIALDVDTPKCEAEVVALFVDLDDREMWQEVSRVMFEWLREEMVELMTYKFFVGKYNENVIEFLRVIEAEFLNNEYTLVKYSEQNEKESIEGTVCQREWEQASELHDYIFPDVYYSGKEMLERLGHENKLFVEVRDGEVIGYCYAERQEDMKWGYIHFLGVKEGYRRKGIGRKLITQGVDWASSSGVEKVSMCVEAENEMALELYASIGFVVDWENVAYRLQSNERK